MSASRNALYVLRLVLRAQQPPPSARSLSTAAAELVTASTPSASPRTSTSIDRSVDGSQGPTGSSFLEPESSEYQSIALTLPSSSYHPEPIQWPTLFPHPSASTTKYRSKMCNPLYRLVAQEDYTTGLRVLEELQAHGQHIQHRHIYLDAMVDSLKSGNHVAALKWLSIYPNRPATANHPDLKQVWEPIINMFINDRKGITDDLEFLQSFMILAGKKGLLPTLLPPILPHLAFSVPFHRSRALLERCITAYIQSTTSEQSTTIRAEAQRIIVEQQIAQWWASYMRKLIMGGWKDETLALYETRPMGVEWDEFTTRMVEEYKSAETESESAQPEKSSDKLNILDITALARSIRLALHDLPTPTDLAALIRALSHPLITHEHPTLLARFKRRFTRPPSVHCARTVPTIRSRLWVHADILNLQREGHHQEAIKLFGDNLIWIGLPDHPSFTDTARSTIFDGTSSSKIYPNIQIITTLLPSLILTLPSPLNRTIPPFLDAYIAAVPSFPPSLQPTSATYSVLLRELTHYCGSLAGLRALRSITSAGLSPGEAGYAGVLLALAGKRNTTYMWSLINQAERDGMVGRRTYRGLVAVLVKTGLGKDAEKMFWRAREKLSMEDIFDGLDLD